MATAFFFGTNWTEKTCVPAVGGALRALSASIVSIIFIWRTWGIWCNNRPVLYFLMIAFIPTTVFTWASSSIKFQSLGNRFSAQTRQVFDALCVGLSTYELAINIRNSSSGLGYFFISIALQVLNLIFLLSSDPAKQNIMITFTNAMTAFCLNASRAGSSWRSGSCCVPVGVSDSGPSHGRGDPVCIRDSGNYANSAKEGAPV
ncbi:hypothetical protein B0H13DRAFT_1934923 [Mycena leptocephala]|nr:hypothetical protein B0H13DRAFT_1934923 [Mycena leptocephala]